MSAMQTTKQKKNGMAALAITLLSLPVMFCSMTAQGRTIMPMPSLHRHRREHADDADAKKPPEGGFFFAADFVLKSQHVI
jgi:hypothetical protein